MMKTVSEIAAMYNVTPMAVYKWLQAGLPCKWIKVIGRKPYRVINPEDVLTFRGVEGGTNNAKNT